VQILEDPQRRLRDPRETFDDFFPETERSSLLSQVGPMRIDGEGAERGSHRKVRRRVRELPGASPEHLEARRLRLRPDRARDRAFADAGIAGHHRELSSSAAGSSHGITEDAHGHVTALEDRRPLVHESRRLSDRLSAAHSGILLPFAVSDSRYSSRPSQKLCETSGSNCVVEQRSISATATSWGSARRYARSLVIAS
jgi:hypothetical protein